MGVLCIFDMWIGLGMAGGEDTRIPDGLMVFLVNVWRSQERNRCTSHG